MIQTSTGRWLGSKAVELGLLLAAIVALSLMASKPAHAATFTVNSTGDAGDATPDGVCDADVRPFFIRCTLREAIQEANFVSGADTIKFAIPGNGPHTIKPSPELPEITQPVTIDGYTEGDLTSTTSDDAKENTLATGATNAVLKIELDGTNAGAQSSGLSVKADNCVVRGLVINRFDRNGVSIFGSTLPTGVRVEGNFIGTDPTGTQDLGNGLDGVFINAGPSKVVGRATPAARNIISGNTRGMIILGAGGNTVLGNLIGTEADGISDLGNSTGAANTIAFNRKEGVLVRGDASTGNRILRNSIFSNGRLGINLLEGVENAAGATANDPGDTDTGPNTLQNKPVLTSAVTSGGSTTIQANLNSTPDSTFVIRFFSDPAGNEGKVFRGQKSVSTDSNGNATFSSATAVPAGQTITATSSGGDTSEFSTAREVTKP